MSLPGVFELGVEDQGAANRPFFTLPHGWLPSIEHDAFRLYLLRP